MKNIAVDAEGFLIDKNQWNRQVAIDLALSDGIELNDLHWQVIDFIQDFYESYEVFPLIRQIRAHIQKQKSYESIGSIELYEAFPHGVLKQGAKFAGLVKPPGCI